MRAFVSYSGKDGEFVRRLVKDLIRAGIEVDFDQRSFVAGDIWYTQAAEQIGESDVFLLVLSGNSVVTEDTAGIGSPTEAASVAPTASAEASASETSIVRESLDDGIMKGTPRISYRLSPKIRREYDHARTLQDAAERQLLEVKGHVDTKMYQVLEAAFIKPRIISILIQGDHAPHDLRRVTWHDFRDIARYQHEFDRLLTEMGLYLPQGRRHDLHFEIAVLDPHPAEVARLQQHISDAVVKAMAPFEKSFREIVEAQREQSWLLSTEMIAVFEANAKSEIFVATTHLSNDVYDEKIRESVKSNMDHKNIIYTYFVKRDLQMERRVSQFKDFHGPEIKDGQRRYQFIYLEESELLMPFDEVVIYDGFDRDRWGYIEMTYRERHLFLRLGPSNVTTIYAQLKSLKSKADALAAQ